MFEDRGVPKLADMISRYATKISMSRPFEKHHPPSFFLLQESHQGLPQTMQQQHFVALNPANAHHDLADLLPP